MDTWWELGEGRGLQGDTLQLWRITCALCGEKGNFTLAFHAEKKKPNADKRLNFDVYRCENCAGFVHVFWLTRIIESADRCGLCRTQGCKAKGFPAVHFAFRATTACCYNGSFSLLLPIIVNLGTPARKPISTRVGPVLVQLPSR